MPTIVRERVLLILTPYGVGHALKALTIDLPRQQFRNSGGVALGTAGVVQAATSAGCRDSAALDCDSGIGRVRFPDR